MSRWNHSMCDQCWKDKNGKDHREAVRLRSPTPEACCYCGTLHTSGIYVRADPADLACKGEHASD